MGYRVGNQCYESKELATNFILSQSLPSFSPDGVIRPEFRGDKWYLNNQIVSLSFPECSPTDDFQDGFLIGVSVFVLFIISFGLRLVARLLLKFE